MQDAWLNDSNSVATAGYTSCLICCPLVPCSEWLDEHGEAVSLRSIPCEVLQHLRQRRLTQSLQCWPYNEFPHRALEASRESSRRFLRVQLQAGSLPCCRRTRATQEDGRCVSSLDLLECSQWLLATSAVFSFVKTTRQGCKSFTRETLTDFADQFLKEQQATKNAVELYVRSNYTLHV